MLTETQLASYSELIHVTQYLGFTTAAFVYLQREKYSTIIVGDGTQMKVTGQICSSAE